MEHELQLMRQTMEQIHPIPQETWEDFSQCWKKTGFKKGSMITEKGWIEPHFYFVLSGVQRIYFLGREGQEAIVGFSFRGNFSGAYDSFMTRKPSFGYLHAITDSEMLAIEYADYQRMIDQHRDIERWARLFIQNILFGRLSREQELLSTTAEERFSDFMQRADKVLLQIPQKYLASYLNMTPETFSRLRAKVR